LWLHFHIQLHQIITLQHNTMLIIGQLFLGTCRMKPATNWFDESFATFLKSHERFARQHRSRPSNTYHGSSANSRKDHQLSGIKNIILLYRTTPEKGLILSPFLLSFRFLGYHPRYLTIFSNSLIRVTRRDEGVNIVIPFYQLRWPVGGTGVKV